MISPAFIYALVDPRTRLVRYVGKTQGRLAVRIRNHLSRAARPGRGTHTSNWIRGLAAEGLRPTVEILEVVGGGDWQEAERRWISYYRARGSLCNQTDGGEGVPGGSRSGWRHSDEAREKIGAAKRGRPHTPEHRARLAAANRLRADDPAIRQRISEAKRRYYAEHRKPPVLRPKRVTVRARLAVLAPEIAERYLAGNSLGELASVYGVSRGSIHNCLIDAGVPRRHSGPRSLELRKVGALCL